MLRRNVRVNLTNRNETDVAFYRPDVFLRVNKAEQHGLGKQPGLFKENLGNELEKKSPFFYLSMLSHWVVQWEIWELGAGEHCPNFPKGPFQLPNRWARSTASAEKLGCSLVSCPTASAHLCLLYSSVLRTAFLLLLLISATWLLGLMAVNSDVMTFHYLFAIFSCLQVSWMASCLW